MFTSLRLARPREPPVALPLDARHGRSLARRSSTRRDPEVVGNPSAYGVPGARHAVPERVSERQAETGLRSTDAPVVSFRTKPSQGAAHRSSRAAQETGGSRSQAWHGQPAEHRGYCRLRGPRARGGGRRLDRTLTLIRGGGDPRRTGVVGDRSRSGGFAMPSSTSILRSTDHSRDTPHKSPGWLRKECLETGFAKLRISSCEHVVVDLTDETRRQERLVWENETVVGKPLLDRFFRERNAVANASLRLISPQSDPTQAEPRRRKGD